MRRMAPLDERPGFRNECTALTHNDPDPTTIRRTRNGERRRERRGVVLERWSLRPGTTFESPRPHPSYVPAVSTPPTAGSSPTGAVTTTDLASLSNWGFRADSSESITALLHWSHFLDGIGHTSSRRVAAGTTQRV